MIGRRLGKSALHDHSVAAAIVSVAGRAENLIALTSARQKGGRDRRCFRRLRRRWHNVFGERTRRGPVRPKGCRIVSAILLLLAHGLVLHVAAGEREGA